MVNRRNVQGKSRWTKEEEAILCEHYFVCALNRLAEMLPRHTEGAIKQYALKNLGLRVRNVIEPIQETGLPSNLFLPGDNEKQCTLCSLIKPLSQFMKQATSPDGYHPRCRSCYNKSYSKGKSSKKLIIPPGHRQCTDCLEIKPVGDFAPRYVDRDGKRGRCKACRKVTDARKDQEQKLQGAYGLSLEEYDSMLASQNGVCACCGNPEPAIDSRTGKARSLAVDHCHATDAIRGLLCSECNIALGLMAEDPDRIKALLTYIEERCLW